VKRGINRQKTQKKCKKYEPEATCTYGLHLALHNGHDNRTYAEENRKWKIHGRNEIER
jgi:hypothetical protein